MGKLTFSTSGRTLHGCLWGFGGFAALVVTVVIALMNGCGS